MPHELIYTSSPRGLKAGATGYCTVAHTPNLPTDLANQLEGISHYRHLQVGSSASESANPVAYAHSVLTTGYTVHHVVSRVADSGLDHSGRSNFLAHHVAFGTDSLPDAGPAWLCGQRFFVMKWDRAAGLIPDDRSIPSGHPNPKTCHEWKRLTGDAGWGGVLAAATNAAEPATIIFEPGQDVLALIAESMALLPTEARWNVTFNTYFTGSAVRTTCQWRCVVANSVEAKEALTARRGAILRLDQPMVGVPSGPLVEAGRTGIVALPTPLRRAAPAAVRTTRRPVEEELPEPDLLPMSRRPRTETPRILDESNDELDLREPAAQHSSGSRGSVGPLLLGLALGGLLILALLSLVEIVGGQSLLGFAGVKGKSEVKLEQEKADLEQQKTALEAESKARLEEGKRNNDSIKRLETELRKVQANLSDAEKAAKMASETSEKAQKETDLVIKGLQTELLISKAALAEARKPKVNPAPQPPIAKGDDPAKAILIGALEHNVKGSKPRELFVVGLLAGKAKPKIRVLGLAGSGLTVKEKDDGVAISGEGTDATISVDEKGVVTLTGQVSDNHPLLGLAVIEITPEGADPVYRQLFKAHEGVANLKDPTDVEGKKTVRFALDMLPEKLKVRVLSDPQIKELSTQRASLVLGRSAIVQVGEKEYDLYPSAKWDPKTPLTQLETKLREGEEPKVALKLENGKLIVDLATSDVMKPTSCRILRLDVVRPVDGLPNAVQEFYRAR